MKRIYHEPEEQVIYSLTTSGISGNKSLVILNLF